MAEKTRTLYYEKQSRQSSTQEIKPMGSKVVRHHQQARLATAVPYPTVLPRQLLFGLWGGMAAGAVVGLIFGWLLFTGILAPRGWEAIFSPGPFSFFWTMLGLALGGVGTILIINHKLGVKEL